MFVTGPKVVEVCQFNMTVYVTVPCKKSYIMQN